MIFWVALLATIFVVAVLMIDIYDRNIDDGSK